MIRPLLLILVYHLLSAVFPSSGYSKNDVDSVVVYKTNAAKELTAFENMAGALRIMSRLFGDQLNRASVALERATSLSIEPDAEILFLDGILQRYKKNYDLSISKLKRVTLENNQFACFGFPNVYLQLGATYADKGEYDLAVDAYKQGVLIDLQDTWPLIELSNIFILMNRPEEATESFYGGLNSIKATKRIELLFTDVRDIATKEETEAWHSASEASEKLELLRTFWKRRDPSPVDQINQRLVEHYKRLAVARSSYGKPTSPWYDDRGRIYVRLGKPDRIYVGRPKASIKDNETWFYTSIDDRVFFDFVNMNGGYELRSLMDAVDQGATMTDLFDLYDERSSYNAYYANLAMKIRTQRDVSETRAEIELREAEAGNPYATFLALEQIARAQLSSQFQQTNEFRQDYLTNEAFAATQRFVFDVGAPHLPINCNFSSFRSLRGKSRLEFYWAVPFSQLVFNPNVSLPDRFASDLKLDMKILDLKYNEVATIKQDYDVTASASETGSHFFLDQVTSDLVPGKYTVAMEVRNNDKDRVGIYQFTVSVRDYAADTLSVSDIELAQYVDNSLSKDKFQKPGTALRVVPNPAAGVLKNKPLTIYYEIYNLTLNDEGKSAYEVSYSIRMLESDRTFFSNVIGLFSQKKDASTSSVTQKEGKSVTEREHIAFDISELTAGIAKLEVRVKDLWTGEESTAWTNITIVEDNKSGQEDTEKLK